MKANLKIAVADLAGEWRLSKEVAGGEAVVDLGRHLIDTIVALVNPGYEVSVPYSKLFKTQISKDYNGEDTAHICLETKQSGGKRIVASNLVISRTGLEKFNKITNVESKGIIVSCRDEAILSLRESAP